MNRAYSTISIKSVDDKRRTFKGIASTPSTDRMGDIVEPKGAQFKLPIPLLWQHNSRDPIGWITAAKITDRGIEVEGEVADIEEDGELKKRLLKAWQMIKAKLVRGLSIGFNSIESARIDGTYGIRFLKWEWLELSAVTIPANQDASITAIKSMDDRYLAALGNKGAFVRHNHPGASGINRSTEMKTLQELKAARAHAAARMQELLELRTAEDRASTEEEAEEFDGLAVEVQRLDDDIRQKTVEMINASTAREVSKEHTQQAAQRSRGPSIHIRSSDADEKFQGQNFTRMVIAKALAQLAGGGVTASGIAQTRWGKSAPTLVRLLKANEVAAGGAATGEWGAELVDADSRYMGDFIAYLTSRTVYDRLPLRQVPANVVIKGQDGTATGYWVGEALAIPASAADFTTVSLSPLKVAALAVVSNELLRDSTPAAEQLVRDSLVDASSQRIDTTFLSATGASDGVSPAGLLNGLQAITSAGVDGDAVRADIKALYAPFITAKNASGLQLIMNPALAKSVQLMNNALGQTEFPGLTAEGGSLLGDPVVTGDNVNAAHMILLKPSDIYRIGDTGVEVSVSREATIEMSSNPAADGFTPTGQTQNPVGMFQNEMTALKVVRSINFAKRRASAVAYVGDADYGSAGTT